MLITVVIITQTLVVNTNSSNSNLYKPFLCASHCAKGSGNNHVVGTVSTPVLQIEKLWPRAAK